MAANFKRKGSKTDNKRRSAEQVEDNIKSLLKIQLLTTQDASLIGKKVNLKK